MSQELDEKTVELLKRSEEQQGMLESVKIDQHGNILSGRHRKAADPKWRETTVMVADELDRLLKIVHFNVQRRPSREETASRLVKIAEILEKKGVEASDVCREMAKIVPYSEQWIRELLPDKYKHIEKKREFAKVVSQTVTTQDMPPLPLKSKEPTSCDGCTMGTWFAYPLKDGRKLCRACFEYLWKKGKITKDDLLKEGETPIVQMPKEKKPSTEVKTYKPKETAEFRRAQMHPVVSKMESAVLEELHKRGHKVESQKMVCLEKTVVDFIVDGKPVYLDGKRVHRNREWTDTRIRERLAKILGETVYAIPYDRFTKAGVQEIVDEIEGK